MGFVSYCVDKIKKYVWKRRGVIVWGNGDNIKCGSGVCFGGEVAITGPEDVVIGSDTIIALRVIIHTVTHDLHALPYKSKRIDKRVLIGSNVWIGTGAIILPGIVIGDNAVIGAGAVVTKDVEKNDVVAGVPAKSIKIGHSSV